MAAGKRRGQFVGKAEVDEDRAEQIGRPAMDMEHGDLFRIDVLDDYVHLNAGQILAELKQSVAAALALRPARRRHFRLKLARNETRRVLFLAGLLVRVEERFGDGPGLG